MIRRSPGELMSRIREFFVAVDDEGRIIGMRRASCFLGRLAELKCLAVAQQAQGLGSAVVSSRRAGSRPPSWRSDGLHPDLRGRLLRAVRVHRIDKAELPHKSGTNACGARSSQLHRDRPRPPEEAAVPRPRCAGDGGG